MSKQPLTPKQAEKRLADLASQLERHLAEYAPHETFVSADLARWFVDAVTARAGTKQRIGQALGLERTKGRPKDEAGAGRYFTLALRIHHLRGARLSWSKVAAELDYDAKELRDIYARNEHAVLKHLAGEVNADLRAEDAKRPLGRRPRGAI